MVKAFRYFEKDRQKVMMRLNLENQLKKVISNEMDMRVIKLNREESTKYEEMRNFYKNKQKTRDKVPIYRDPSGFNQSGEFVRNAYIVFMHQYMYDKERIKLTNRKLYVEATFNSITDTSYELWVLRTFMEDVCQLVSIGMMLIPKE